MKRRDSHLVAKAIDVDLGLFHPSLLSALDHDRMGGAKCTRDLDCTFFNCRGECDTTTGVCSGRLISSNLVVRCVVNVVKFVYRVLGLSTCTCS